MKWFIACVTNYFKIGKIVRAYWPDASSIIVALENAFKFLKIALA